MYLSNGNMYWVIKGVSCKTIEVHTVVYLSRVFHSIASISVKINV